MPRKNINNKLLELKKKPKKEKKMLIIIKKMSMKK